MQRKTLDISVNMQLIIFGPPGVGKGTLSDMIAERYSVPHISTGEIFRKEIKSGNRELIDFVEKGLLVPDNVVNDIVKKALLGDRMRKGFVLDGYPRTIEQSEFLDGVLRSINKKIGIVLNLVASDDTIISRLTQRRMCGNCGALYNLVTMPPRKDNLCDNCGSELIQRKDDSPETIGKRLRVYYDETAPLVEHYRKRNLLVDMDASVKPKEVFNSAVRLIKSRIKN